MAIPFRSKETVIICWQVSSGNVVDIVLRINLHPVEYKKSM